MNVRSVTVSVVTPQISRAEGHLGRHYHKDMKNPGDSGYVFGPATSQADLSDPHNIQLAQQSMQLTTPTPPQPQPEQTPTVSTASKDGVGTIVDKRA